LGLVGVGCDDNEGNSAGPDNNVASTADHDEVSVFNDFRDDGDDFRNRYPGRNASPVPEDDCVPVGRTAGPPSGRSARISIGRRCSIAA
jgi:hypothetical protein